MTNANLPANVYRLPQGRYSLIPGHPWVYWLNEDILNLFETHTRLEAVATPRQGLATANNARFFRYWWEVGLNSIYLEKKDNFGWYEKRWFPCMKGGRFCKWYGNQEHVINWESNGREMKAFLPAFIRNPDYYFKEGITYNAITSGKLSMRWMPSGFIFDHAGNCLFPLYGDVWAWLALLNSRLFHLLLQINPTINLYTGDLKRMPVPNMEAQLKLTTLAQRSTRLMMQYAKKDEITYEFISPVSPISGIEEKTAIENRLKDNEDRIEIEVQNIYHISDKVRQELENYLLDQIQVESDDSENGEVAMDDGVDSPDSSLTLMEEISVRWVSYALGIIIGRFEPGNPDKLGCAVYILEQFARSSLSSPNEDEFDELVGRSDCFAYIDDAGGRHIFSLAVEEKLRALADSDGIAVLDQGHPDDLPAKVETALELMLGETGAAEVIAAATGESHDLSKALRRFLERRFFTHCHVKQYRSRPVYWLLQSPQRLYGLYLFHERLTRDTLFVIQRQYVDRKINLTKQQLAEQRLRVEKAATARERRELNKQAENLERLLLDVEEFARRLKAITDRGYTPHIDDGVILNMSPLWEVIPSWSKEPKKYWEGLMNGEYDWAHLAMDYWPERVREKCRTDKSLAIAHGHEEWFEG